MLSALGKFKNRLTKSRGSEDWLAEAAKEAKHDAAKEETNRSAKDPPPAKVEKAEEVDWEAKAQSFLEDAVEEEMGAFTAQREAQKTSLAKAMPNKRVIMATKYQPGSSAAPAQLKILQDETASRIRQCRSSKLAKAGSRSLTCGSKSTVDPIFNQLKNASSVIGENSIMSEFAYYDATGGQATTGGGTPIVDIGAADNLNDLVMWADTDAKKSVASLALLKEKKHGELLEMVRAEEAAEAERKRVERSTKHPSVLERVRVKHKRERKERELTIRRIRQENEMIIANRLAGLGFIR